MGVAFILVHSPIVGPYTWVPVAAELADAGHSVAVPVLDKPAGLASYWRHHVDCVVRGSPAAEGDSLVVAGHSGAGPLLPAIAGALDRPVSALIFVDANLPRDGASRLDLFGDDPEVAAFRASAVDGHIQPWPPAILKSQIHDPARRAHFAAELEPTPLAVYEEPLPVPAGWSSVPCGYLHFSSAYDRSAAEARARGWPAVELPGTHMHMLNDPAAVARRLLQLATMGEPE